jgi:hypothetical protein
MLEYLSQIHLQERKDSLTAYPQPLRYTDDYVDFLYSSVEKDVEWGQDRMDVYANVEFLAAPQWIASTGSFPDADDDDDTEDPPPIVKGTSFPRLRMLTDSGRYLSARGRYRDQILCDFERRPHPPPFTLGPPPPHDENGDLHPEFEHWYDMRYDWLTAHSDTVDPPSTILMLTRSIDLTISNPNVLTEHIWEGLQGVFLIADGLKNETASPEERLSRCRQLVRAFPEWFLVKGVRT